MNVGQAINSQYEHPQRDKRRTVKLPVIDRDCESGLGSCRVRDLFNSKATTETQNILKVKCGESSLRFHLIGLPILPVRGGFT